MKRHLQKIIAGALVVAMLVFDFIPLAGVAVTNTDGGLKAEIVEVSPWINEAKADVASDFQFAIGGKTVPTGGQLEYTSEFGNGQKVVLTINTAVPAGATYEWVCDQVNVINIKSVDPQGMAAELNILAPGYSGLYVYIRDAAGNLVANPYCVVHVPLEWDDTDAIKASDNAQKYGLMYAMTTDQGSAYTLQMYSENSGDNSAYSHYLRKIRRIEYKHIDGTTAVKSDIEKDKLAEIPNALEWYSSDPAIVEVDPKTGYIEAKSAGFARVTARTTTKNASGMPDEISVEVVVVPEAIVVGYTNKNAPSIPDVKISPTDSEIIIQSNAGFADALTWKIYRDKSMTVDLTSKYKDNMEVSSVTGRVVLRNLPAGKYYIVAISVRDSDPTYDIIASPIIKLGIELTIPLRFPASPIILNYYNTNMADIYDILENSNLPEGMFAFASQNATVASFDTSEGEGVIKAVSMGSTTVTITALSDTVSSLFGSNYPNLEKFMEDMDPNYANYVKVSGNTVTIDVDVINGISLSSTEETMALGSTLQLLLTSPNPYDGQIIWSSNDEKILKVDGQGLVTAVGVGEAIITARIKVEGVTKRARCRIKVVTSVNSIVLSAKNDYVRVGDNLTISATITPKVNNAELTWSCSDETIASIADTSALSMTITGVKPGTVVITAVNKDNAVVGSIVIKVIMDITSITLSDTDVTLPLSTGFYQLYATCSPELPENQKLTWSSSDKKVVTVDQNGKVTLVKPGKAVITVVTENGIMAMCNFTVKQGITGITLDKTELRLSVGQGERLTYVVKPDTASELSLKWTSSNTKIATVDSTGYVTGKNIGECVVMAQTTDGTGIIVMCNVTVTQAATSIKLDVTAVVLNVNETYALETALTPLGCSDTVTYESSDKKIATVNKKGKIQGKSKGTAVVVAKTSTGLTAYCNVTVVQQVTGIKISESEATIMVGDELELEAVLTPKSVSDSEITWKSSKTAVATVNSRGEVEGVSPGTTLITCTSTDGGYSDVCVVTVEELVSDLRFEPDYVEVGVGKKLALNVIVDSEKASNKNVTYKSSSKKICTVNSKGVITGVRLGTAQITVTATDGSGATAICDVRVINATEEIEVDPSYIRLVQGESETITATAYPANATYTPLFISDNENVAIVNKKGVVTGVKPGNAIITAVAEDDESVKAVTYVEVIAPVNATSVTFADSEVIMVPGETKTVPFSIVPSNVTESYTWSSDNPAVATVDEYNGRISARAVGSATVTLMTQSGKKGTIRVFVVGLSRESVQLHQYERLKIKLEVDGAGSENLKVRWDTDNQTIAEVTNGTITGKALGTTNVYAIVNGRRLACSVKVIKNR